MKLATDSNLAVLDVPAEAGYAAQASAETEAVATLPPVYRRLRDFYELTKPRMNFLVVVTTLVGFYLASSAGDFHWKLLAHTLIGTVMTAAAAAVLNQLIERDYDALMPRTVGRPLPSGTVLPSEALALGILLGILGANYLAMFVNIPTATLSCLTMASYLAVYTPLKRVSSLNTVVGAIPGAIPPLMGVTAVSGTVGRGAFTEDSLIGVALFAILFVWQMPHFLAIAILYKDDYAKGGFKMLPTVDPDLRLTARVIVLYALALLPTSLLPIMVWQGQGGRLYAAVAIGLGLLFLAAALKAAKTRERGDARKLFFASIIYLPLLLTAMAVSRP